MDAMTAPICGHDLGVLSRLIVLLTSRAASAGMCIRLRAALQQISIVPTVSYHETKNQICWPICAVEVRSHRVAAAGNAAIL